MNEFKNKKLPCLPGEAGSVGVEIVREFGIDMYTLLSFKWITNKNLLYSTWNSAQYCVAAWMGGEFGGDGYMYTCG